ncbi:MAG: HAD family hydrolase [Clostridia bacterium]|nr:HAD family hydrolase [Clostridia bacterium]
MNYSHIIWDFNGTILNDVQTGIDAVNVLLERYGKKKIDSVDEYRAAFGFPVIDYYDRIGLERENFTKYAPEWVAEYNLREAYAPIFDGIIDLMEYFRGNNCPQYLLSATESQMLKSQVKRLGIGNYFEEIIGQSSIEAHGKIDAALNWLQKNKPEKALFIGDSLHDFEVAQAMNIDCVLLTWGHQSKEKLKTSGCRVFDTAADIQKAFENGEI